jgi:riboflavin synthase
MRLDISAETLLSGVPLGASVAVNGVCLTLAEQNGPIGGFDVIPETWRLTNLSQLSQGDWVNLERSLRVGDRIDGHFVQGHVDGVGTVERIERGGEWRVLLRADEALARFIVRKGSIALDGVSLTVVDAAGGQFSVALIPTTLERTTLGALRVGGRVNIETDILARMIVARVDALLSGAASEQRRGVTKELLRQSGFAS